jgi:hypothetical protein
LSDHGNEDTGGPTLPFEDFDVPRPTWAEDVAAFLGSLPEGEADDPPQEGRVAA